jgi:hypothetical protein
VPGFAVERVGDLPNFIVCGLFDDFVRDRIMVGPRFSLQRRMSDYGPPRTFKPNACFGHLP